MVLVSSAVLLEALPSTISIGVDVQSGRWRLDKSVFASSKLAAASPILTFPVIEFVLLLKKIYSYC